MRFKLNFNPILIISIFLGMHLILALSNTFYTSKGQGIIFGTKSNNRSHVDQPDENFDSQIHFIYALPSDGIDRELDISGSIETSVNAFQKWLFSQTEGRTLRTDTFDGSLDISFCRLKRNDTEMQSYGAWIVTEIEKELKIAGFNSTNKIYAVYYDGGSTYACGGAAWPPFVPGQYAAMYLLAKPTGYVTPCTKNDLTTSEDYMNYWEFALLHDIFHVLGAVSPGAPHHTLNGHVSDSNTDLMYSGSKSWLPSVLDYGSDDYYGHNNPNYVDIEQSPFLTAESTDTISNKTDTSSYLVIFIILTIFLLLFVFLAIFLFVKTNKINSGLEN